MSRSLRDAFNQFEANKGSGGVTFFKLQNDREKAFVRILHAGEEDLDWYIVHEVMIAGRKSLVQCLEGQHCPGCQSGNRAQLKLFIQLLQSGDAPGVIRVWERGQSFIPKVLSFLERNATLCGQVVEIERLGRANDSNTTYNLYPGNPDGATIDKLPPRNQLLGPDCHVLTKSVEEMTHIFAGTPRQGGTPRGTGAPGQQFGGAPGQQFGGAPGQQFGGAPQQFGAAPQQFGAAPQQFGAPQQQFGAAPGQQFGAAPQQFGATPQQQFGAAPQQTFTPPQQTFEQSMGQQPQNDLPFENVPPSNNQQNPKDIF